MDEELTQRFSNRGLSYSVWSDGFAFVDRPVAVTGNGYRAFEQALLAARRSSLVTLLFEGDTLPPLGFLAGEVERCDRLKVLLGARVVSLEPGDERLVRSVGFERRGERRHIEAHGLFVAHEPVLSWVAWGGEARARELVERGRLHLAPSCGTRGGCGLPRPCGARRERHSGGPAVWAGGGP